MSITFVPGLDELGGDRAADRPGPGHGHAHQARPLRRGGRGGGHRGDRAADGGRVDDVLGLQHGVGLGEHAGAEADDERHAAAGGLLELGDRTARPVLVEVHLHDRDGARGVAPGGGHAVGQQHPQEAVGGPGHGGDGRDAQALVDRGALGVVDAGHDLGDAEGLAGHPRGDDVRVVARGDRRERLGPVDARGGQHLAVEAGAHDLLAVEVAAEAAERLGVAVDHGHVVAEPLERQGEGRPHAPAAHHDDVHAASRSSLGRAGTSRTGGAHRIAPDGVTRAVRRAVRARLRSPRVQVRHGDQAPRARPAVPQRRAAGHAAAQAHRPARVRLRRPVVGGVRAAGGADHPVAGRAGRLRALAVGRRRGDRRARHGRRELPPERARLPLGRRRLRDRDGQPRQVRRA